MIKHRLTQLGPRLTKRKFIQSSLLAALIPLQFGSKAKDKTMEQRISTLIAEYSSQGIHRTGTEVDHRSADWLIAKISALGVEATETAFGFQRLQPLECSLRLGQLTVPGVPLYDCSYTEEKGFSGSLGPIGSQADIGVAMAPPFANTEIGQAIYSARLTDAHRGIIIVSEASQPKNGIALLNAEHFSKPFGPPVLQVAGKHWREIQLAIASSTPGHLTLHAETIDAIARNIGATIEGKNRQLPPLVIMTPRSGWWQCASERGGGIACFLEMMRAIKASEPQRDVIFTANTGHELGHIGLAHYLDAHATLVQDALVWIHLGANFAARQDPGIRLQYSDEAARSRLRPWLEKNSIEPDTETPTGERPLGEARNIFDGGGRYLSILGRNGLFHHPDDLWPDAVNPRETTKWINAFVALGVELAGSAEQPHSELN